MTRVVLTLLAAITCAAVPSNATAQLTGALDELENCAKLMTENNALLKTWSGRAEISHETTKGDKKELRTTDVEFLYKADGHQVRFSSTQAIALNGIEKLRVFESAVKSRTEYCHFPAKLLGDPRSALQRDRLQRMPADQFQPHVFSTQFDPTVFASVSDRGNAEELRYFRKNAGQFQGAGTVTVAGDRVTLRVGADGKGPRVNYTFDKSHAGMPTHFERSIQVTDVTYEVVDGIHLPSAVTIKRESLRDGLVNMTVKFRDSKVNAVVDDAEFEADKLPPAPRP